MPIKEISAESVRDKSIRQGHISTLHLWWARRPLPVCRAVVFASLIPDPLDENCPKAFKDAVEILLGKANNEGDPYKPYEDIPYTAAIDKMEDNLRNRLLMFIGKFSDRFILNERQGKKTDAKDQLSDASLIKWDNKSNDEIINKARKLIWVAHNSTSGLDAKTLFVQFDQYYKSIKDAEKELYSITDRHIKSVDVISKEEKLSYAINGFLDKMPKIFDPFAGGGAIPLEAARLGCRSYGNDLNPVAHLIQKGSLEFPQKYGKPIILSKTEFIKCYGNELFEKMRIESPITFTEGNIITIKNRLSFDVEFFANKLIKETEKVIGKYYPIDSKGNRPIAYYWGRVGICSNPTCKAEVPLLRQFSLVNSKNRHISLKPIISGKTINFEIINGSSVIEGWMERANLKCPCCGAITQNEILKDQFKKGKTKERILAVIMNGKNGKEYRLPTIEEIKILNTLPTVEIPSETLPLNDSQNLKITFWGFPRWGDMFLPRQLLAMHTFISKLKELILVLNQNDIEYYKAIILYLGIFINRLASRLTSFGLWNTAAETLEHPFGRQAIPMIFDFPESNPFTNGTGGASNQIEWIVKFIDNESYGFSGICNNAASGDKEQFAKKSLTAVITDPPYYDAIAYADLSDFFYIWFKRSISSIFPLNFVTPQTPKSEECTALKHHHGGDLKKANLHFEHKLTQIFDSIEHQTSDIVSIMFAHQSTKAWTTLCNSILSARMNITGSWAIDTERSAAGVKAKQAFLSSSVTVASRPAHRIGIGEFKDVRKDIEKKVYQEVNGLYRLGFRGADLLTACFGQAVSVFGKYEKVEKADGSEVTVTELLDMAKEYAFNALLKGFDGDDFTKFYIGWLQLYGFSESEFDDAAKFSRVGLTINVSDLFSHNLFIKNGNKQELAGYKHRWLANRRLAEGNQVFIIDNVHKAMALYEGTNRSELIEYISKAAISPESSFWRVITSLYEVLPQGSDDYKQAAGLLLNKDSLIRESKTIQPSGTQGQLF